VEKAPNPDSRITLQRELDAVGMRKVALDPKKGVTDRNGKVHGVENLYACGASLSPTAGWQHPTLTIIALTLRLAKHLSADRPD
jgi:choline dehydrogenase-like flavoprotein